MGAALTERLAAAQALLDQGEAPDALAALIDGFSVAATQVVAAEQRAWAADLARRLASALFFGGDCAGALQAAGLLGAGYLTQFRAGIAPWLTEMSAAEKLAVKRAAAAALAARAPARPAQRRLVDPTRRVTVAHLIQGAHCSNELYRQAELRHHDRAAFRLIHYTAAAEPPDVVIGDDQWVAVGGLSDAALFDRIVADGVDILVDHCDLLSGGRLPVLAAQPAPILLARGGLLTTSVAAVRWRLSDAVIHPLDGTEPWDETILRLPHYQCFPPPEGAPGPRAPGPIRFGAFCQLQKITPATAAAWSAILEAVPGATLTIKRRELSWPWARRRLSALLAAAGAASERVMLIGDSDAATHRAAYAAVDICLDPFPFGGHTTTCEALAMGAPVVALLGDGLVGRMGPSYLVAAGRAAWATPTVEVYRATAISLARDLDGLAAVRRDLAALVAASPLCDGVGWTRSMEAGYLQMIEAHNRAVLGDALNSAGEHG